MSSLMARQLADVSDEVRAVPAPPLPELSEPYGIRYVDPEADAAMISEWMNRPHLASTWHYDYPADQWQRHLSIQFEGNFSRPVIVTLDGQNLVYMEFFRAAQDDIATLYHADPYDVGFHSAIVDSDMLDKGHAQKLVPQFLSSVFSAEPQCRRFMGDTLADRRALGFRGCVRVGGVLLGEPFIEKWGRRVALFAWPRTPEDLPALRESL